jgi:apolipoprotein D and lipocalin family protein
MISITWKTLVAVLALGVAACSDDTAADPAGEPGDGIADAAPAPPDAAPVVDDPTFGPVPAQDTVDRVEIAQYVGSWYEIARIPQGFQRDCTGTTATYEIVDAETVSVLNRCYYKALDGELFDIEGTAKVVDAASNAKLEVDFGFAKAPYWIVELGLADGDAPYPWAVVSNPERTVLWILSRTPQMDEARYQALVARLAARGFGPERLEKTLQPSGE